MFLTTILHDDIYIYVAILLYLMLLVYILYLLFFKFTSRTTACPINLVPLAN